MKSVEEEADLTKISQEDSYIVQYFAQEVEEVAQIEQNPKKKADIEIRLKQLYRRLINNELSPDVLSILKKAILSMICIMIIRSCTKRRLCGS